MKEKVKEQIEIWQRDPDVYLGHGKGYRKMTVDDLVEQISRLHQKECESIVEEILERIEHYKIPTEMPLRYFILIEGTKWQALQEDILKKVRGEK